MNHYVFILGAPDLEMDKIEKFLKVADMPYKYATANGRRVTSDNAYYAEPVYLENLTLSPRAQAVFVECAPAFVLDIYRQGPSLDTISIDHHRLGDKGYAKPPTMFMQASSIGQVLTLLARSMMTKKFVKAIDRYTKKDNPLAKVMGKYSIRQMELLMGDWYVRLNSKGQYIEIPRDIVLVAAADHCLAAVKAGRCLGIERHELKASKTAKSVHAEPCICTA
ncbi:MAG: hypothetical protein GY874_08815 [Desulfobacteraceae bacterium]|nr:hypothetical protein [Desulfobacteraceae bacterium]